MATTSPLATTMQLHHATLRLLHSDMHDRVGSFLGIEQTNTKCQVYRCAVPVRERNDSLWPRFHQSQHYQHLSADLAFHLDHDGIRYLRQRLCGASAQACFREEVPYRHWGRAPQKRDQKTDDFLAQGIYARTW